MSIVFGAGNNNRWTTPLNSVFNQLDSGLLVTGWWYPTTLTAGRGYWAGTAAVTVTIGATTSQLTMVTNCGTDGSYTADAGIVVDKWQFIAIFFTRGDLVTEETFKVWVGDETTVPTAKTVTTNAVAAGAITSGTLFVLGNTTNTANLSFQGSISQVSLLSSAIATVASSQWGISTYGSVTADEEDFLLNRFVLPLYYGQVPRFINDAETANNEGSGLRTSVLFSAFETNGLQLRLSPYQAGGNVATNPTWSFNGTSFSQEEPMLRQTSFAWPQGGARLTRRRP